MQTVSLEGGFVDTSIDAAHAFRAVMNAMARPGEICTLTGATPPAQMSVAAGVTLLTLCDPDTPVFLGAGYDTPEIRDWIAFHTGAPVASAEKAMFAIGTWDNLPLDVFQIGTPEYPDRSATVIVEMPVLSPAGAELRGPGIKDKAQLSLPDVSRFQTNAGLYPLGLDFLFTCDNRIAGLPRTTRVSECM